MRLVLKTFLLAVASAAALSACGGASQGGSATEQSKQLVSSQKTAVATYGQVVEQLYVAYFGRPADPTGLANFSAQLAAAGAPPDIAGLLGAYNTNTAVKTLVDSFGTSAESIKLYGNSDPTAFVQAVFQNVLGRAPATQGLNFWVSAITSGNATYGNAALQIMEGALTNNTTQGQADATLIDNRIAVATDFTADVSSQNATADYVGSTAAASARATLTGVTASTSSSTFASIASSAVASIVANTPAVNNVVSIAVDQGADPSNIDSVDAAFVSVTICAPGNASVCQTIDHVLVDTGSYGLRLLYSTLSPSMASALASQTGSGSTIAECTNFIDGYTWGPLRHVDFSLSGEKVSGLTLQVIGDPSFNNLVPSSCSSSGNPENTVQTFGSNGVIGVGMFSSDCGGACALNAVGVYFSCANGSCNGTKLPESQQVTNPVSLFASDNNGVIIQLPSVSTSNPPSTLAGNMVFGINTQSNNVLPSNATVMQMNDEGNFTTVYSGGSMTNSFIDSGSNGLYFPNRTNIATCSDGFYCPSSVLSLSAVMQSAASKGGPVTANATIPFTIGYADSVTGSVSVDFGAPNSDTTSFDWGLPFFFGRNVFVLIDGETAGSQTGPLVAF